MPQLKTKQQWKRSSNVGDDVPMTEDGYMSTDFTEIRRDDEGEEVHARESANEQRKKFATDKVDDVGWMDGLESDKRGTGTRRRWKKERPHAH